MKQQYSTRATQYTIAREGDAIYSETTTRVEIADEAAGEFIVITQSPDSGTVSVSIEREFWPLLRDAIDQLVAVMRDD